jgi:hypothetical protein
VLAGLLRGLDDAGYAYGLYSYANGWREIAGTWRLPGLPVWATAGRRGSAAAQAMCPGPSFSGGPVHLAQWYDDTRDYDLTCPAYRQAPPMPYPPSGPNDLDGNWTTDVVARDRATGDLWLYPRDAAGRWTPRVRIGTGWQRAAVLDTSGDLTGDGVPDLLAVDRVTGDLWLYPRRADATFAPRVRAGTGWQVMDAVLGTGDLTGDGVPDVVAREGASGRLWLYPRTAAGGFAARRQVGTGWQGMNAVLGAGDLSGDGVPDLLARERSSGALWLYPGNGRSGFAARARIGGGWNAFDLVATPGDVDRDGKPDVLARDRATASLWLSTRDDAGAWRARVRLGTGWRAFDAIQ